MCRNRGGQRLETLVFRWDMQEGEQERTIIQCVNPSNFGSWWQSPLTCVEHVGMDTGLVHGRTKERERS